MAAISGRNGTVQYKTKSFLSADHWDCTITGDMLDVTSFSTVGVQWRSFIPGLSGWNGTISGFYNIADTTAMKVAQTNILTPATGTIKLWLSDTGGENLSGSIYWQTLGVNVDVADSEKFTLSFQGNGALAYATA
jgi:predicted secreted protein